jgi:hypothetical protein
MDINVKIDTPLEELLELWAKYTYKVFYKGSKSKEELQVIRDVSKILDNRGIEKIQLLTMTDSTFTLQYFKHGTEFVKKIGKE